jgi:hypothetical protein
MQYVCGRGKEGTRRQSIGKSTTNVILKFLTKEKRHGTSVSYSTVYNMWNMNTVLYNHVLEIETRDSP